MMQAPKVVSRDEWLEARLAHLAQEKEFTRRRDELSAQRRAMPWVKVENSYQFDTSSGRRSLADLFDGRGQLIVQHFMYGPDWEEGCPSCSFWADGYDGFQTHLAHRDVTMVSVSSAPLAKLDAYKKRMGWSFDWVSSASPEFNRDFQVTFTPEEMEKGEMTYNFERRNFPASEAPGISVFARDAGGGVFHTYSCYARGLDMMNAAYHYLDLVPKGRDEDDLPYSMAWLRRHDAYED
jgi:predicted dithiol-disulfide oxidoreductase (DUF899 family)